LLKSYVMGNKAKNAGKKKTKIQPQKEATKEIKWVKLIKNRNYNDMNDRVMGRRGKSIQNIIENMNDEWKDKLVLNEIMFNPCIE